MSVHHAQAIERASVAIERAKHRPVRKLARAIVKAQEGEIEQFRDWLVAWYAGSKGSGAVSQFRPSKSLGPA